MKKLFFIVNEIAGSGRSGKGFEQVRRILEERGIPYGCEFTQAGGHAIALTKAALLRGEKTIVAVGGDGTLSEVASVMCGREERLGMLPLGTGNDFAKALHLPTELESALEVLLGGQVRRIDAGRINGRFFINVAGLGFDVDVLNYTLIYKKHLNGLLPYILGVLRAIAKPKTLHMTISIDGVESKEDLLLLAVGNGTHFGGGMKVTPNADLSDGLFDICMIREIKKKSKFVALLPDFVKGEHLKHTEYIRYERGAHIIASAEPGENSQLDIDGEIDGGLPVEIELLPGALNVLVKE